MIPDSDPLSIRARIERAMAVDLDDLYDRDRFALRLEALDRLISSDLTFPDPLSAMTPQARFAMNGLRRIKDPEGVVIRGPWAQSATTEPR
jgi:hypothetical protein